MHRSAEAFSANLGDEPSAVAPYVADYAGAASEPDQPLAPDEQHALPLGENADAGGVQQASESVDGLERDTGPVIEESLAHEAAQPVAEELAEPRSDAGPQVETEATSRLPWAKLRARFLKSQGQPADLSHPEPEPAPASTPMPESDEPPPEPAHRPDPEDGAGASSSLSLAAPERRPREAPLSKASGSGGPNELNPGEPAGGGSFRRVGIADVAAAPTIVGRYEAGGASYVLLSDGAIEVETETGTHRFASMQDLKAFIEAQEPQSTP